MRCRLIQRELRRAFDAGRRIDDEVAILAHVRVCPACGAVAEALGAYRSDAAAAALDDLDGGPAFETLRARVESGAARRLPQPKELWSMATLIRNMAKRPRFGLSVTAVAAVLIAALVIPLTFQDNAIGYEVAFAGVDRAVALDTERIDEFLAKLGVSDAEVVIGDCEETCRLKVRQLKSADEAYLVYTAFSDFASGDLEGDVEMALQGKDGKVKVMRLQASDLEESASLSRDDVHRIVVQCIGEEMTIDRFICLTSDSLGVRMNMDSLDMANMKVRVFDASTNPLDAEAIAELEAQGIRIEQRGPGEDGEQMLVITMTDSTCGLNCAPGCVKGCVPGDSAGGDAAGKAGVLPEGFALNQNYPNPFNPSTTISFALPEATHATLEIYNVNGQKVATVVDEYLSAGEHAVVWDGSDDAGSKVASGVYLYRLTAGEVTDTKKMTLVK